MIEERSVWTNEKISMTKEISHELQIQKEIEQLKKSKFESQS